MGYYTNYEVTITSTDPKTDVERVVTDFFQKEVFYSEDGSELLNRADNISQLDSDRAEFDLYELKWYDYDRDIRKLAKKNPDLLIVIEGTGEGDGNGPDGVDMWKHAFRGDQDQRVRAVVTIPNFSEPFEDV